MKLKEKLQSSNYLDDNLNVVFDNIYFIPTRRKHSSGYLMFEIYGSFYKNNEEIFYCLSKCSDVLDFEKINCNWQWFCSIDMKEYNVFRIFARTGYKFSIPFYNCSSFLIDIIKVGE